MKKVKFRSFVLLFSTFIVLGSCSQEDAIDDAVLNPIPDPNNPTTNFFKASFNGSSFVAQTRNAVKTSNKFIITGGRGTVGENISISVNGTNPGVYSTPLDIIIYNKSDATAYDYVSYLTFGTTTTHTAIIEITSIDTTAKRIAGTFDFVGYWSNFNSTQVVAPINFTNGSFEMPYSE
jgi:hypothetical protein